MKRGRGLSFQEFLNRLRAMKDPATREECERLPLHMKHVPSANYNELSRIAPGLEEVLRQNTDATTYRAHDVPQGEHPKSDVSSEDLKAMFEAGVIERTTRGQAKRVGKWFTVVEKEKKRRRAIFHPRQLNDEVRASQRKGDVESLRWDAAIGDFPPIEDTLLAAAEVRDAPGDWATAYDLRISFHQLELATSIRPYFVFRVAKQYFRLTRMPMGAVRSPAVMHAVTAALARTAAEGLEVTYRAFIDNVRFLGDRSAVVEAGNRFTGLCRQANITLNEEPCNAPHQVGTFLGMECDYSRKSVRLAEKSVRKITEAMDAIDGPMTVKRFMSLFGLLNFAARVLRLPVAAFYHSVKFARRRYASLERGEIGYDDDIKIWPCVLPQLRQWMSIAMKNAPVTPTTIGAKTGGLVMVTDASCTGWGAVLFNEYDGSIRTASGKWPSRRSNTEINDLEAEGVLRGLEAFSEDLQQHPLTILVDNTSVMHTLRKGCAREFMLNHRIDQVLRALGGNENVRVGYIETGQNPSDSLSRGKPLDMQLMSHMVAGGRWRGRDFLRVAVPEYNHLTQSQAIAA